MGVFARKRGKQTVYFFRTEVDGKQYERIVGPRKDDAEKALVRFRDKYQTGGLALADPRSVVTLEKFSKDFLAACADPPRAVKLSTLQGYERRLARMSQSRLGKIPLSKLTLADWEAFREERSKEHREGETSVTAINRDRELLRNALRTALEKGKIDAIPNLVIRKVKGEKRRDYAPPLDVVRAYLKAAEKTTLYGVEAPTLRDVGLISATTGARLGEIVRLSRKTVTEAPSGYVWKVQDGKSEASSWPMLIPRKSAAFDVVKARLKASPDAFPYDDPEELVRKISKAHRKLCDRLELDKAFVVHSWRHLAITVRAFFEANPVKLRQFARHEDIRTTMIYLDNLNQEAPKVRGLLGA